VEAVTLGSARASRASFGASPNERKFGGGIVVPLCVRPCSRRGAANGTRGACAPQIHALDPKLP